MIEHLTLILSALALLTMLCQWFAWWVKLPAIIFLLLTGLILGPTTGWFHPDEVFGHLLFPMISLAVAIILFEGSLTLKLAEVGNLRSIIRNLVSIGYLITVLGSTLLAHFLFKLPWQLSVLFGAVTSIGGPTVVAPILRSVRLKPPLGQILHWESVLIDPIGTLISVLAFGIVVASLGNASLGNEVLVFVEVIIVGSATGIAAGFALAEAIKRQLIPDYLHNVATLGTVLCIYSLTSTLSDGGGLLAVTIMGITMANIKDISMEEIINFKESLSVLLISGLFIILSARIHFYGELPLIWPCIISFLVMQFVLRPLAVWASSRNSELDWRQKIMLSLICPRGIVCAAVASMFSFKLSLEGYPHSAPFVLLTFIIIMSTVLFQSATAKVVAKALGVFLPNPYGVMIIGANTFSRKLSSVLEANGITTQLVDNNWRNIAKAKMDGLNAFYGNPLADNIVRYIQLSMFGEMFALTPNQEFNMLCCWHYKENFGRQHVHTIQQNDVSKNNSLTHLPEKNLLFRPPVSYIDLAEAMEQHQEIKANTLTEQYTLAEHKAQNDCIYLLAINPQGKPIAFTTDYEPPCADGWTIITLKNKVEEA